MYQVYLVNIKNQEIEVIARSKDEVLKRTVHLHSHSFKRYFNINREFVNENWELIVKILEVTAVLLPDRSPEVTIPTFKIRGIHSHSYGRKLKEQVDLDLKSVSPLIFMDNKQVFKKMVSLLPSISNSE